MNIPILSYILRKLRENLGVIKKSLKTGKETQGKIKKKTFLGIFNIVSGKRFQILKLKNNKKWLKPKQK